MRWNDGGRSHAWWVVIAIVFFTLRASAQNDEPVVLLADADIHGDADADIQGDVGDDTPSGDDSAVPSFEDILNGDDLPAGIETFTVTAQRRSEILQEVAAAASAISGQQLEAAGINQIGDIQAVIPNLHFGQERGEAKITIRGVSNAQGTDQSTAVHIDGVYQNRARALSALTFFDVQRVEVLRGPQGTLYGRNATGGAMNIISTPPSSDLEAYGDFQLGNYHQKMLRAVLNVPIIDDLATFRVSGFWEKRNGYQKNFAFGGSGENADDADDFGLRSQLRVRPSDSLDITMRFNYAQKRGVGYALKRNAPLPEFIELPVIGPQPIYDGATANPSDERHAYLDAKGRIDNNMINGNVDLEWQVPKLPILGETQLRVLGSFTDFDDYSVNDQDYSDLPIAVAKQSWKGKEWVGEINWSSDYARKSGWLIGLFHLGTDNENIIDAPATLPILIRDPPPLQIPVPFFQEFEASAYSVAGFANGWYRITDKFRIEAGVRYSHDWKESGLESPTLLLDTTSFVLFQEVNDRRRENWGEPTGSVSIDYQISRDSLVYGRFATGYKAGTLNNDIAPIGGTFGDPDCTPDPNAPDCDGLFSPEDADPETIYSLESGLKNTLFDNRLVMNSTVFVYWYNDLQVSQLFEAQNFIENAATARIWGIELESEWNPIDPLTLKAHVSYLDAEYTDYEECRDAKDLSVQDCTGNQLSRSPRFSGNVIVTYEFDLKKLGTITPFAQIYASDEIFFRPTNESADAQEAYYLLTFRLGWQSRHQGLGLDFFIDNALDKDVATTKIVGSSLLGSPLVDAYDRPRTVGARLSYSW